MDGWHGVATFGKTSTVFFFAVHGMRFHRLSKRISTVHPFFLVLSCAQSVLCLFGASCSVTAPLWSCLCCVLLGVLYFFHLSDSLRDDSILVCKCCEKFRYDPFPTPDGPKVAAFWHQAKRNAIRRRGKVGWVTVAGLERIWTFPTCVEMSWYLFVFGWFPRHVSDWVVVSLFLPATRSCSFH